MIDKYYLVDDDAGFVQLRENWDRLCEKCTAKALFLDWQWMHLWWQEYGKGLSKARLAIVVFESQGEICGILPLYCSSEAGPLGRVTRGGFIGDQIESSDYLDVLTTADHADYLIENLDRILAEILPAVDVFYFKGVFEDSIVGRAMSKLPENQREIAEFRICPYLTLPDSLDTFLAGRSKNLRYNIRRRTRKLFDADGAVFEVVQSPEEVSEGVKQIFDLHSLRAEQKNLDTKFVEDVRYNFHRTISKSLAEKDKIRLFFLNVDGARIASLYCFDDGETLYYFQGGFDPEWSKKSPGMVIMAKVIEYGIEHGRRYFDFMRGGEEYKFSWTDEASQIYEIHRPVSRQGRMFLKSRQLKSNVASLIKKSLKTVDR